MNYISCVGELMELATKILIDEHKNIIKVVNALEREAKKVSKGGKIDKEFYAGAIDFVRNYADGFHHAKEEDILFEEFCKNEHKAHCNPTTQMLYEHDEGRHFIKNLEKAVKEGDKENTAKNALGYAELLKEHIYKEDNIMFPMADKAITKKTQEKMLIQFNKAEEKKFPKGTKEKYIALADELDKWKSK